VTLTSSRGEATGVFVSATVTGKVGSSAAFESVLVVELDRRVFWSAGMSESSVGEARSEMTATRWAVGMRERKLLVGLDILFGGMGDSDVDGKRMCVCVRVRGRRDIPERI